MDAVAPIAAGRWREVGLDDKEFIRTLAAHVVGVASTPAATDEPLLPDPLEAALPASEQRGPSSLPWQAR